YLLLSSFSVQRVFHVCLHWIAAEYFKKYRWYHSGFGKQADVLAHVFGLCYRIRFISTVVQNAGLAFRPYCHRNDSANHCLGAAFSDCPQKLGSAEGSFFCFTAVYIVVCRICIFRQNSASIGIQYSCGQPVCLRIQKCGDCLSPSYSIDVYFSFPGPSDSCFQNLQTECDGAEQLYSSVIGNFSE